MICVKTTFIKESKRCYNIAISKLEILGSALNAVKEWKKK